MKPKVDFCFKELMQDADIRRGFLSSVLGMNPEDITKTELMPTHLRKSYEDDKLGILDVRVLLNGGVHIDLEIQLTDFEYWAERALFYLSKMYTDQIHKGDDYGKLKKCIHIGILNFSLFNGDREYYSVFHLWEDHRRRMYSDKFELHILELPKVEQYEYEQTRLLNWVKFINAEEKEELAMLAKTDNFISKAYERLVQISADEKKRQEYEEREKAIRDYNHQIHSYWRQGHESGLREGHESGLREGRESGVQAYIELSRELEASKEATAKRIVVNFSLTEDEAWRYINKYWIERYPKLVV